MPRFCYALALATSLVMVDLSLAQTRRGEPQANGSPEKKAESPRERVDNDFDRSAPKIGELLPDVAAYHADGNTFPLRSLKGHYSVLVFGCLT